MKLLHSPAPEYYICAKKIFEQKEEHVTRIYGRSVLILMLSGTLKFREGGEEIALSEGEYYVQMQKIFQEGLPLDDPPTYYYIEFNGHFSESGSLPLRGRFDRNIIEPLFSELQNSENVFAQNAQMNRIFARLCADISSGNSTAHKIKRFISSNYSQPLSLSDIASEFGYTEDHITRLFKKEYGITPHKQLIETRLEHALWLLENTNLPAERVCEAVGYLDFSSFWRAFKKKYSLSPGEIRKKLASK
jgi:AraC-like DNA-binding protein